VKPRKCVQNFGGENWRRERRLEKLRFEWEDDQPVIKGTREIGGEGVDWIFWLRTVNSGEFLWARQETSGAIKQGNCLTN
jgi:hypothetical protein